jgi:hypothetical protein
MSQLPLNYPPTEIDPEYVEAAMRNARVLRSAAAASLLRQLWSGLRRAFGFEVTRDRAAVPHLKSHSSPPRVVPPVTADELRRVFGGPARSASAGWRKSA